MPNYDEYEIYPVDPLKKLETEIKELKRIVKLREEGYNKYIVQVLREIVEMLKVTQTVVASFIKSNSELQIKISELTSKVEDTMDNLRDLIEILKEAAMEAKEAGEKPVEVKVDMTNLKNILSELAKSNDNLLKEIKALREDIRNALLKSANKKVIVLPPNPPKFFIQK